MKEFTDRAVSESDIETLLRKHESEIDNYDPDMDIDFTMDDPDFTQIENIDLSDLKETDFTEMDLLLRKEEEQLQQALNEWAAEEERYFQNMETLLQEDEKRVNELCKGT